MEQPHVVVCQAAKRLVLVGAGDFKCYAAKKWYRASCSTKDTSPANAKP